MFGLTYTQLLTGLAYPPLVVATSPNFTTPGGAPVMSPAYVGDDGAHVVFPWAPSPDTGGLPITHYVVR